MQSSLMHPIVKDYLLKRFGDFCCPAAMVQYAKQRLEPDYLFLHHDPCKCK
jgi:hypothetical protein